MASNKDIVKKFIPRNDHKKKRTSIGLKHFPRNKSKKHSFKKYRGQGRP